MKILLSILVATVVVFVSIAIVDFARYPGLGLIIRGEAIAFLTVLVTLAFTSWCIRKRIAHVATAVIALTAATGFDHYTNQAVRHLRALIILRAQAEQACEQDRETDLRLEDSWIDDTPHFSYRCTDRHELEEAWGDGSEVVAVFADGSMIVSSVRVPQGATQYR